jgi:hypothetical protein
MTRKRLYDVARIYVKIIEALEQPNSPDRIIQLEEERVIWHNMMIDILRREGIPFQNREDVTRLAFYIARRTE